MARVFLAFDVVAPWPQEFPKGRIIPEELRHLTLVFLGEQDLEKLPQVPKVPFQVGMAGKFNKCIFLPPKHPHVVAWDVNWLYEAKKMYDFQKDVQSWALKNDIVVEEREFLYHMTISRGEFSKEKWEESFKELPFFVKRFCLYKSLGNSNYERIWAHDFILPFEELSHTADIAFKVHGENFKQLGINAFLALSFKYPELLDFFDKNFGCETLDDIVIFLNTVIGKADAEIGVPFKAISFHGELKTLENNNPKVQVNILEWEMVVDV